MPQAKHTHTTLSMLDVIDPGRRRFAVVKGGRKPKSSIMQLIDRLALDLAAGGPMFPDAVKAPRNPYVDHIGRLLDPEKAAQWEADQRNQRIQGRLLTREARQ